MQIESKMWNKIDILKTLPKKTANWGKEIVIFGTSLVGSYMITRGLTLVFDEGYPSEIEVFAKLQDGQGD